MPGSTTTPKVSSCWAWLRTRILSIGMILAMGLLLLVSLAASAAFDAFAKGMRLARSTP